MNRFYEISGLLAFVVAWFGMLLAVFTQGIDKGKSISLHAASSKKTIVLLAVLSPISMFLFATFSIKWMVPNLQLPLVFTALSIVAYTGYILAAWVPSTGGLKTKLHDLFSYSASLLLLPITLTLVNSPNITATARWFSLASITVMLFVFVVMVRRKETLAGYLYFQIAYFLAFDLSLLAAGYIR